MIVKGKLEAILVYKSYLSGLISIPFLLPTITLISHISKKKVEIILKFDALKIRTNSNIR
jgi:hypothetical protein